MRIFLAGGAGAIGTKLVPRLVADGHEVVASTRSAGRAATIKALGAEPVIVDALDRPATVEAVTRAQPELVIHELTALTGVTSFRNLDREFEITNRLRSEGTDHLLEGARAAGARRFIVQSFAGWNYAPSGSAIKTEEDPLNDKPPNKAVRSLAAIRHAEGAVLGADSIEGVVLRYGGFYGPGTGLEIGGSLAEMVIKRRFPIIGDGSGIWSFIHIDDAAGATAAAVEHGQPGVYNVVDDEPLPLGEWLPLLAQALGAKPPRHLPMWLGRIAAGETGMMLMTRGRAISNAKARRELSWVPRYRSVREGFATGLGQPLSANASASASASAKPSAPPASARPARTEP